MAMVEDSTGSETEEGIDRWYHVTLALKDSEITLYVNFSIILHAKMYIKIAKINSGRAERYENMSGYHHKPRIFSMLLCRVQRQKNSGISAKPWQSKNARTVAVRLVNVDHRQHHC